MRLSQPPDPKRPGCLRLKSTNNSKVDRLVEEDILIWIGVVAQLTRTRSNRLLTDTALPYPLFVLLRHFSHDPEREWTITQLTSAFETGQSGMTKKVQKLLAEKLLNHRADAADARVKWFSINQLGLEAVAASSTVLRTDIVESLSVWSADEIATAHDLLFRLKSQLDENR